MPKRTILLQSPARITVENSQLTVAREGSTVKVPLEDIWVIIIESLSSVISTAALSRIADAGIGVMLCDGKHMPNALSLPIGAHSRHAAIVENQLSMSRPFKKRLWQLIVKAKINNQAFVLRQLGLCADDLLPAADSVLSNDSSGREAAAAAAYFKLLIRDGTRRASAATAALDYGYAVLRAGIARTAVSGGWLVSRGIHHCSELNAFNLVDDLIEPFRPVVDLVVFENNLAGGLDTHAKQTLASVFEYCIDVGGKTCSVQSGIEAVLDSFKRAVLAEDADLIRLPSMLPLAKTTMDAR